MTAPWLRRRSKTEEVEGIAALCAIALHFVVMVTLGWIVVYSDQWLLRCYVLECGIPAISHAIYGFLIFDILLFLVAWGLSVVLSSRGWWRIAPPLAGTVITAVAAAIALNSVMAASPWPIYV